MTTYQTQDLFTEILEDQPIPLAKLEYFRTQFQLAVYDLVASNFNQQETLNQAEYARRLHRRPEAINRLLSGPGNWTIDTVCDLLIGLKLLPIINREQLVNKLGLNNPAVSSETELVNLTKPSKQQKLGLPPLPGGDDPTGVSNAGAARSGPQGHMGLR